DVANISISFELAPCPALVRYLIDDDALAFERLGSKHRIGRGFEPHGRLWIGDFVLASFDKLLGTDLACEMLCGEIRTCRRDAGIKCRRRRFSHVVTLTAHKGRVLPGTPRLQAGRACQSGSRHRCRNGATPSPVTRIGAGTAQP